MAKIDIEKLAVVYARFSSHAQGEQSIEGQITEAKKYAATHGYTIIHEYVDRAKTGRNDNREQFQKMLSDVSKKQFGTIIVWKVDRFGRNREEITLNKYHCKKHGVQVKYVAEVIPDTAEGVILESVLEGFAEYYSLQLSQNIRRGLHESAMKCHVTGGGIPIGYKTNKEHEFLIDEEKAPIVRKMFEMYLNGSSIREIVDYLNKHGYKTNKNKDFTFNSVYKALSNRKYIGIYTFKDIEIPDGIPRIIDDETFFKVQTMKQTNKRSPAAKWSKAEYLLTDKIFCGKCGAPMRGESGHGKCGGIYHYYACSNRKRFKTCSKKAVKRDEIESYVLEYAKKILWNNELLEFIINNCWNLYQEQDNSADEIKRIKNQIISTDNAINNLLKVLEKGVISTAVTERLAKLEQEKTDLQASISEIEIAKTHHLTREIIAYSLYNLREFNYDEPESKKRLIDTFVNSVYVFDDHLTINFNYSGDKSTVNLNQVTAAELDNNCTGEGSTADCLAPPKNDSTFCATVFLYLRRIEAEG